MNIIAPRTRTIAMSAKQTGDRECRTHRQCSYQNPAAGRAPIIIITFVSTSQTTIILIFQPVWAKQTTATRFSLHKHSRINSQLLIT